MTAFLKSLEQDFQNPDDNTQLIDKADWQHPEHKDKWAKGAAKTRLKFAL